MTGEAHEKAIEAAHDTLTGRALFLKPAEVELVVAAYLASLAEQGDPLVRVSEVVEWLREQGQRPVLGWTGWTALAADAIEARFAPEASS